MKKKEVCLGILFCVLGIVAVSKNSMVRESRTVAAELSDQEHPKVALTFDDGPHPVYTPKLLEGLKKKKIHATFFLIGKNISVMGNITKRLMKIKQKNSKSRFLINY